MSSTEMKLRIGELSRRTGVSPSVLRAWEHRYAVIRPDRSRGGLRLFSAADEQRIRVMRAHMRNGLSAAEAARAALAGESPEPAGLHRSVADDAPPASELAGAAATLTAALSCLDQDRAHAAMDRLLATSTFETVASRVLIPYLADLGSRWRRGDAMIAEEHLATQVLRGRLLALAYGRRPASGPRAVLACPPREMHDIALVILAVALERRGWNVTLLGADTPIESMRDAAGALDPDCVVIAARSAARLAGVVDELRALGRERQLLLAGPGASEQIARETGARLLHGDPISAAEEISGIQRRAARPREDFDA